MTGNKMGILYLVAALSIGISGPSARAGGETGNGGNGLWLRGKLFVLDLVEAGCETPRPSGWTVRDSFQKGVELAFSSYPGIPTQLIAQKLSQIYDADRLLGRELLVALKAYSWAFVDASLIDVHDEEGSPIEYPPSSLVQLAVRKGPIVRIDRDLWSKLDDWNRAGLIIHEMVYALIAPVSTGKTDPDSGKPLFRQSSLAARQINGYLFSQSFDNQGRAGLLQQVGEKMPVNNEYNWEVGAAVDGPGFDEIHFHPVIEAFGWSYKLPDPKVMIYSIDPFVTSIPSPIRYVCDYIHKSDLPDPQMRLNLDFHDTAALYSFGNYLAISNDQPGKVYEQTYVKMATADAMSFGLAFGDMTPVSQISDSQCVEGMRTGLKGFDDRFRSDYEF